MNARSIYYVVLGALAAAGATIAQYMGGWDNLTKLLAWVMGIDYLTGALCALVWHKSPKTATGGYESNAGFKGLVRKGVIVLIVMIAAELDKLAGTNAMRTATILFFAANDGMSILENLGIIGVPYPPALKNAFEVLRRKSAPAPDEQDVPDPVVPTVDTAPEYKPRHDSPAPSEDDLDFTLLDERPGSGLLDEDE